MTAGTAFKRTFQTNMINRDKELVVGTQKRRKKKTPVITNDTIEVKKIEREKYICIKIKTNKFTNYRYKAWNASPG